MTASATASVVIGIGLLLALTATLGPLPSPGGEPGASLAIRLPDTVRTVVLVLVALSVVILLALQRPRRASDDDPLPVHTPRRLPTWVAALIPLTLIGVWYLVWHRWSGGEGHPIEDAFTAIAGLLELLALARKPPTSLPFFDVTIAVLGLLLALGLFVLMVLIALADRLAIWRARRPASAAVEPVPDPRPTTSAISGLSPTRGRRFSAPGAGSNAPWRAPRAARAVADPHGVHARHGRPAPRPDPPGRAPHRALRDRALQRPRPGHRRPQHRLRLPRRDHRGPHNALRYMTPLVPILVRCGVLTGIVLLVAVPVYVFVEPPWRGVVARLASAFVLGVALLQFRSAIADWLNSRGASGLDAARGWHPVQPVIPLRFLDLIHDVRAALRSRRHFEKVLWPRLMSLAQRPLVRPASRPGRGPSLASLREVIAVIEKRP